MKSLKYMNKKNLIISIIFFLVLNLASLFYYLFVDEQKKSYYLEYSIEYDESFINGTFYALNIEPLLITPDYISGKFSYIECNSMKKCKIIVKKLKNSALKINNSLWDVTENFMKNHNNEINSNVVEDKTLGNSKMLSNTAFKYYLQYQYLKKQEKPLLLMLKYKIIENTFNKLFTDLFKISMIGFILTLILYTLLYFFSPAIRDKK